jgi:hypothetical protein
MKTSEPGTLNSEPHNLNIKLDSDKTPITQYSAIGKYLLVGLRVLGSEFLGSSYIKSTKCPISEDNCTASTELTEKLYLLPSEALSGN